MDWKNTVSRYGRLSLALHWGMLILLIAVVALMELRGMFPKGSSPREAMKSWHYTFGMLVFALAVCRVAVRLAGPYPKIVPAPPPWQHWAALTLQAGMYGVMLAMPVLGYLLLSVSGDPIAFLGWPMPPLAPATPALVEVFEELHEFGARAAYLLVGLHIGAAIYHHSIVRDNTLRRMLP